MTRDEILSQYRIKNGTIVSPGKFQGQPIFAPYYWEELLQGFAEEDEDGTYSFDVYDEDVSLFPELKDFETVFLAEDDQGFVDCAAV